MRGVGACTLLLLPAGEDEGLGSRYTGEVDAMDGDVVCRHSFALSQQEQQFLAFVAHGSQVVAAYLPFSFPSSVIGMILLFICLLAGVLKIEHIQEKADFLMENMAFFFVPAGVSVMNYFDILKSTLVPFLIICIVSTIITFAATAYSVQFVMKLMNRRKK